MTLRFGEELNFFIEGKCGICIAQLKLELNLILFLDLTKVAIVSAVKFMITSMLLHFNPLKFDLLLNLKEDEGHKRAKES